MLANAGDVSLTTLASHGPTTQFKSLMGAAESRRDKLAAASRGVNLFLMYLAPGGANIPHHHDMEREIYYILRGSGDMVAAGGADGKRRTLWGALWRCVLYPAECHRGIL
jgi:mannose-6-phosphate isomerase-like protein (cupin superfamily)